MHPAIAKDRAYLFLEIHGTYLPRQEKMRVLSSQKLAYRFINYSMDSLLLPRMCLFLLFVREPRVRHSYSEIRSRFSARLVVAAAEKSRDSFSSFLLASINLSSSLARDSFFQHADYARARTRSWFVIEQKFRHYIQREGSNRKRILVAHLSRTRGTSRGRVFESRAIRYVKSIFA